VSQKNKPTREQIELLLQRLFTDRIPIVGRFQSEDESINVQIAGFFVGFGAQGIAIATDFSEDAATYIRLVGPSEIDKWVYVDDAEIPADKSFSSTLQIPFANGSVLFLSETRR